MQQIERYGVIALLLILVTVIAVTTWGNEVLPSSDTDVAKVEGKTEILDQLASTLVVFDPRFEIMPGTKGAATPEDLNDFEYGPLYLQGE